VTKVRAPTAAAARLARLLVLMAVLPASLVGQSPCTVTAAGALGEHAVEDLLLAPQARSALSADAVRPPTTFADSLAQNVVAVFATGVLQQGALLRLFVSGDQRTTFWCAEVRDRQSGMIVADEPALRLTGTADGTASRTLRDAVRGHITNTSNTYVRVPTRSATVLVEPRIARERFWRDSLRALVADYEMLFQRLGGERPDGSAVLLLSDDPRRALLTLGLWYATKLPVESTLMGLGRTVAVIVRVGGRGWGRHELGHVVVSEVLGALPTSQVALTLAIDEGISRGVGGTLGRPLTAYVCDSARTALELLDPDSPDVPLATLWSTEPTYNGARDAIGLVYQYLVAEGRGLDIRGILHAKPATRNDVFRVMLALARPAFVASPAAVRAWALQQCPGR